MTDVTTVAPLTITATPAQQTGQMRTASWRGVPFGVTEGSGRFGRKTSLHEYPYRDDCWVEDLGKATRKITIRGFLLAGDRVYGGGTVFAQRDAMIVACEAEGTGTLVHPTLGTLTVALAEPATIEEALDVKTRVGLTLVFIESGAARFPANAASTGKGVLAAVQAAIAAVSNDFNALVTTILPLGGLSLAAGISAVAAWTSRLTAQGADATSILGLSSALVGPYGRYFNGALTAVPGALAATLPPGTTVADLVALQTADRANLAAAAVAESATVADLGLPGSGPADLAAAAQAAVAALVAGFADPADAVRLLNDLATYDDGAGDPLSLALGDLHRRTVVIALAQAAETYQPSSYNDANAVRALVAGALAVEITDAGDAGDDASYGALSALRVAVIQDLTARGATLAALVDVVLPADLPALALAQRLYRDPTRADQLVAQIDPPNPLFMPAAFQALAR